MSLYKNLTGNEMKAVLTILKNPEFFFNSNSLSKVLEISPMGTLKILKKLENDSVLKSKQIGRSKVYKINLENNYARKYMKFMLSREAEISSPEIKRWINEFRKIKNAQIGIIFGSVLKAKESGDVDVLLVTEQKKFQNLKKEIDQINNLSYKKIHPVYQTFEDIVENIKKRDVVILNAIKGIVIFGEENFMEAYYESCK